MRRSSAFSLVEVIVALGLGAFGLLTLLALLPMGIKNNKISTDETQAVGVLTLLEADLRNTHPALSRGTSLLFGLPLPYAVDAATGTTVFSTVRTNALQTRALDAAQAAVAGGTGGTVPYQVSVVYTYVPPSLSTSLDSIEARLIVSWPYRKDAPLADLTDRTKVSGFVEAYVTFPAP